jgi:Mg/Co/Ni transporter MgtE
VRREALAGGAMGAVLGAIVYAAAFAWASLPREVALTVAVSLPIVSMWSNALGGGVPLAMAAAGFNPAVSSAPLVTTVIDASGLAIYLSLAKVIMGI